MAGLASYLLAIDSGHPEQAPAAAVDLASLLALYGDDVPAASWFQRRAESGHEQLTPRAAFNLGITLERAGDYTAGRTCPAGA